MIPIRIPWTRQPPAGTPIRKDGVGEGLIWFAHFGRNGIPWEEYNNEGGVWSANNLDGTHRSKIIDGMWVGEFPNDQTNGGVDFPQHMALASGHLELTAMCYAKHKQTVAAASESCMAYAGTGSDAWDCNLNTSGDWRWRFDIADVAQTATLVNGMDPASGGADPQKWNLLGGTWSNQLTTARVNKLKSTAVATAAGVNTANNAADNDPRLGQRQNGATDSWDGYVAWGAVWSRDIGDGAWDALVDNPWLLFEPQVIWIPEGGFVAPPGTFIIRRVRKHIGFRHG
jgi:hypothetical protein